MASTRLHRFAGGTLGCLRGSFVESARSSTRGGIDARGGFDEQARRTTAIKPVIAPTDPCGVRTRMLQKLQDSELFNPSSKHGPLARSSRNGLES